MRSLTSWVLYPLFLLAVLIGVTKVLHCRYVARITPASIPPDQPVPAGLDAETATRIGSLHPARRGSFQLAAPAKPPGTVRIGTFGDSFTYGLEVDEGLDWSSQLGVLLHQSTGIAVEVLNFANPGFGAHQTHMMAELAAPRFDLDYAVFAPLPIYWAGRDRSFTFWPAGTRGATHLGFHSRFVLDGEGLALVDPIGATEPDRLAAYTRFVPPWRYLRFDERLPAFLQAWLPEGRTLPNPFYYSRLPRAEEVAEIYRRLLRRQVDGGPPTIVIETMDDLGEIVGTDPRLTPHLVRGLVPMRFPYKAPQKHWSPWGHRLVAEEVARALGVGVERPVEVVETIHTAAAAPADPPREALDTYDEIHVDIEGVPIGGLYQHPRGDYTITRVDRLPPAARFLVALAAPGQPLVDAVFVPLAAPPSAEAISLDGGSAEDARTLPLVWVDPAIARVDLCSRETLGKWMGDHATKECPLVLDWDLNVPRQPLVVRLGNQPVEDIGRNPGSYTEGSVWTRGPYYRVHANGSNRRQPGEVPAEGEITLVLERAGAAQRRVPLGRYRRVARAPQTAAVPPLGAAPRPVPP